MKSPHSQHFHKNNCDYQYANRVSEVPKKSFPRHISSYILDYAGTFTTWVTVYTPHTAGLCHLKRRRSKNSNHLHGGAITNFSEEQRLLHSSKRYATKAPKSRAKNASFTYHSHTLPPWHGEHERDNTEQI